jgi:hypothetical protein
MVAIILSYNSSIGKSEERLFSFLRVCDTSIFQECSTPLAFKGFSCKVFSLIPRPALAFFINSNNDGYYNIICNSI